MSIISKKTLSANHNRLDKWLWHARFYRTRGLAQQLCKKQIIRVNGVRVIKANTTIKKDDILTFPKGNKIIVIKIIDIPKTRILAKNSFSLFEEVKL